MLHICHACSPWQNIGKVQRSRFKATEGKHSFFSYACTLWGAIYILNRQIAALNVHATLKHSLKCLITGWLVVKFVVVSATSTWGLSVYDLLLPVAFLYSVCFLHEQLFCFLVSWGHNDTIRYDAMDYIYMCPKAVAWNQMKKRIMKKIKTKNRDAQNIQSSNEVRVNA